MCMQEHKEIGGRFILKVGVARTVSQREIQSGPEFQFQTIIVYVVVLTLQVVTHRRNLVRVHRPGSNESGVEEFMYAGYSIGPLIYIG